MSVQKLLHAIVVEVFQSEPLTRERSAVVLLIAQTVIFRSSQTSQTPVSPASVHAVWDGLQHLFTKQNQ